MVRFNGKWLIILLSVFCSINTLKAQRNANWQVIQYASNIIKIIYHPFEYDKDYNITNAVIASAISKITPLYKINKDASININNDAFIFSPAFNDDGSKGLSFELKNDEMIFGGGEGNLPLNKRGFKFELYNSATENKNEIKSINNSIPFFISNKGYGIFFDNGSKTTVDVGNNDRNKFEILFYSGEINAYIITGKTYQEILSSYHKLTGTQPLPPRWALGNLMSRNGYLNQDQLLNIVKQSKEEKIPVDAIMIDNFWFGDDINGSIGNLDWVNKKSWPEPIAMIKNLKNQNINTCIITHPYIQEFTNTYAESVAFWAKDISDNPFIIKKFYEGKGGLIDVFRKDATNWIWNNHYKKQIQNGVLSFWTDLSEPSIHPENMYHNLKDYGIERNLIAAEVHNLYGHYWNKMLFDNFSKEYPNKRLFHLTRSGFAGSQRFSIFPSTKKVDRTWDNLQKQIPSLLSMSVSGMPYTHCDAGGFSNGEYDSELFVRWLQFASYTPVFRPHGTELKNYNEQLVSFASEAVSFDEPFKEFAKQTIQERYKLLPYNYTLAYRHTKYGEPLLKPLFYNYSTDTIANKIDDEFLFGDNILITPITKKGVAEQKVYLPKGIWFLADQNKLFSGENFIEVDVKDFKKPVFYKEGSFIPQFQSEGENTMEINRKNLKVIYVPSNLKSSFDMYDDDGESKNSISQNQYEIINFSSTGKTNKAISINIRSTGNYKGKPSERNIVLTIPTINSSPKSISINGVLIKSSNNKTSWKFVNDVLTIPVILKNIPNKIDIRW